MTRVLIHQGSLLLVCCFLSPLQVIERILGLLMSQRLWDTVPGQGAGEREPGQGKHLHPTALTIVIQKRGAQDRKRCSPFPSAQPRRDSAV